MWPKYVQSGNESLKIKHRIKTTTTALLNHSYKIPKRYWNVDGDIVPQKRWTLTEGAKLC